MTVERDFVRVVDETIQLHGADDDLLPTRLAFAAATVLPVDGASISVAHDGHRIPLPASDERSATAERLQFTVGAGPCMTAMDSGKIVIVSERELTDRWPQLADLWREHTAFRSAGSCPLRRYGYIDAVLNLFLLAPNGNEHLGAADLAAVGVAATERLSTALGPDLVVAQSAEAVQRRQVWVAVGMGMSRWRLTGPDALARLRAHAYGQNTTIDELANQLVDDPAVLDTL